MACVFFHERFLSFSKTISLVFPVWLSCYNLVDTVLQTVVQASTLKKHQSFFIVHSWRVFGNCPAAVFNSDTGHDLTVTYVYGVEIDFTLYSPFMLRESLLHAVQNTSLTAKILIYAVNACI